MAKPGISTGGVASAQDLRPARFCGACHGPIRREWESSAMAQSWKNPVFQAFLADAKAKLGDLTLAACISCHAPAASVGPQARSALLGRWGCWCSLAA